MFSITIHDHMMVAHSLKGGVFGSARNLHGATYKVEVEFRRESLNPDGIVVNIGVAKALLGRVLSDLRYRNLDEVEDFEGYNTTSEFLTEAIFHRVAKRIMLDELGADAAQTLHSLRVCLSGSPDFTASYESALH